MNSMNAIIIAGGHSSRMGRDKGLLEYNGKPMIQYVIDAVSPHADRVMLITQNPLYKRFGLEIFADLVPDLGPAGGIYTALHISEAASNMILSCDIPLITTSTLQFIKDQHNSYDISLAALHNKPEPLIGIYEKHCFEKWNSLIAQKNSAVHEMIKQFNTQLIEMELMEGFNPKEFTNVNTQLELENLKL